MWRKCPSPRLSSHRCPRGEERRTRKSFLHWEVEVSQRVMMPAWLQSLLTSSSKRANSHSMPSITGDSRSGVNPMPATFAAGSGWRSERWPMIAGRNIGIGSFFTEFAVWHLLCLIQPGGMLPIRRFRACIPPETPPTEGGIHYDKGEENTRQVTHKPCRSRRLRRPGGIGRGPARAGRPHDAASRHAAAPRFVLDGRDLSDTTGRQDHSSG